MAKIDFALWDAVGGYSETDTSMADVYDEHIRAGAAHRSERLALLLRHRAPELAGRPHHRADRLPDRRRARDQQLAHRRDDVAAALLSPDAAGPGSGDARPALARPGRVRHRHRRARARVHPLGRRLLPARRDQRRGARRSSRWPGRRTRSPSTASTSISTRRCRSPKPFQQPYPPIWAAVHSDAVGRVRGAQQLPRGQEPRHRRRRRAQVRPLPQDLAAMRSRRADAAHLSACAQVHVAPDGRAGARGSARSTSPHARAARCRSAAGRSRKTRIGWGSHARGMGATASAPDNVARGQTIAEAARNYEFNIENGLAIVGSPETVIRTLQEGQPAAHGLRHLLHQPPIGRMPRTMVRSLDRAVRQRSDPCICGD